MKRKRQPSSSRKPPKKTTYVNRMRDKMKKTRKRTKTKLTAFDKTEETRRLLVKMKSALVDNNNNNNHQHESLTVKKLLESNYKLKNYLSSAIDKINDLQKSIDKHELEKDTTKEEMNRIHEDELADVIRYFFSNLGANYFSLPFNKSGECLLDKRACKNR